MFIVAYSQLNVYYCASLIIDNNCVGSSDIAMSLSWRMFSSVQFARINVVLSAKHFRTTTQ